MSDTVNNNNTASTATSKVEEDNDPDTNLDVQPLPLPKTDEKELPDSFYVVRERIYTGVSLSAFLKTGLGLDSDVYKYTLDGTIEKTPFISNRYKLLLNESFKSLDSLNSYLVEHGKIPKYLEIRESPGKGLGVFAKKDIKEKKFLGFYQGQVRDFNDVHTTQYQMSIGDSTSNAVAYVDSENITFSNWTRFINDGDSSKYNVLFAKGNRQIYVNTIKPIKAGEELLGAYDEGYWTALKLNKLP